jgi:hypothetical protein
MDALAMNTSKRHRFPPDIISYADWPYYRLNLSRRAYLSIGHDWNVSNDKCRA